MAEEKTKSAKKVIHVPEEIKREIAILAGSESRYEYEIVGDALRLYKAATVKRGAKRPRNVKNISVVDVISAH